ncbi:SRPBCC family protein [Nakamurella lactea]|uniref:SRPBCC family protein n=1 Tax=Nakamurella lactea TaxID=459515 RepID=UPI00040F0991|nr:SRPBCC family protein [Nakamurella lactea]
MSIDTRRQTEISAHPTLPVITIVREFDASPDKLYRAWTEPELVAKWLGPKDLEMRIDAWDCRTGGSWRYASIANGEEVAAFFGSFHEIRPTRLTQTFTYEGYPDAVALETVWFDDLGDGRTRARTESLYNSMEARDGMMSSGMDVGVNEGYEQLDALLASL